VLRPLITTDHLTADLACEDFILPTHDLGIPGSAFELDLKECLEDLSMLLVTSLVILREEATLMCSKVENGT